MRTEIVSEQEIIPQKACVVYIVKSQQIKKLSFLPEAMRHIIQQSLKQSGFKGNENEYCRILGGDHQIVLVGVGDRLDHLSLQKAGGTIAQKLSKEDKQIFLSRDSFSKNADDCLCQVVYGALLGGYRFLKYKTLKKNEENEPVWYVPTSNRNTLLQMLNSYMVLAEAVNNARDFCNEPANYLTPSVFAGQIHSLEEAGLEIEILTPDILKEKHFNLLCGVAQGSQNEPRVVILKWIGNPHKKAYDWGLVGKGVTFDSGGISLKSSAGMGDMKQDMTGAAVVVSSLQALALQKKEINVVGIVGLVENMPSGSAIRPGDILKSLSGQTVEVLNTDAEGRLVLADCLTYLQEVFDVRKIIDIATLTGATQMALGSEYAGLFTNTPKWIESMIKAGQETDEKVWPLPINKAYDKMLDSSIADMKNIGGRYAGGSTAACFLQRFIKEQTEWIHLDIAGVDVAEEKSPLCPKGATAFGVRLLNAFLSSYHLSN